MFAMLVRWEPFFRNDGKPKLYEDFLAKNNIDGFWKELYLKDPRARRLLSDEAKELFIGMVHVDPDKRLTIEEIKKHAWYQGEAAS